MEKTKISKNWLKTIGILLLVVITLVVVSKNIKYIKFYYKLFQKSEQKVSFTIFNKSIQNDTFFTIVLGNNILKNGIQEIDTLTWHKDLKYTNSRWLFDILVAIIYHHFSWNGITVFVSMFTILIALALFFIIKDRCKNGKIALLCTFIAIYLAKPMFTARAQIVSFLLFIIEYFCIEKLLETNQKKYKILLMIIPIFIANFHASVFLMYFIFYLPYIAEYIIFLSIEKIKVLKDHWKIKKWCTIICNKFVIEKKENFKSLMIIFFLSLFTGFITPIGLAPYTDMIKAMLGASTTCIGELAHSTFYNNASYYSIIIAITLVIIITKVKPCLVDVFFLLGFGIMTIVAYRSYYFFLLIGSISIAKIFASLVKIYAIKIDNIFIKVGVYSALILMVGSFGVKEFFYNQRKAFVPEETYPVKVSEYILQHNDLENMRIYNDFNIGSYLEFKGIKAFIDSRSGMFCKEFNSGVTILEDWMTIQEGEETYQNLLDQYKITHVLVHTGEKLNTKIKQDSQWSLEYADENFCLYERK